MERVNLRKTMEFLVFSTTPLSISSKKSDRQSVTGMIIDCDEKSISLKITDKSKFTDLGYILNNEVLVFTCGYKNQSLQFESKLLSPDISLILKDPFNTEIQFERPEFGLVEDRRKHKRFKLNREDQILNAKLEINTPTGDYTISTNNLFDISATGVAMFIDRKSGLLMPRDSIVSLEISNHELPVLQTQGSVVRIDRGLRLKSEDSNYFAVVKFSSQGKVNGKRVEPVNERRTGERIQLFDEGDGFVEFTHPLFGEKKYRGKLVDISQNGLSFVLDRSDYPIISGMRVFNASLQLPFQSRLNCSFRISFVQSVVDNEQYTVRAGAEFIGVSVDLLKGISILKQRVQKSSIVDAEAEDYDHLWEFFFETGFIYESKRKQLQKIAPKIMETYRRLLREDNPILKKILYKEDQKIKGHISAIRYFDHSWIIQHLNALKAAGTSAAQGVMRGIADFFSEGRASHKAKTLYVNAYYRPNNIFPAAIFGGSVDLINDLSRCNKELLDFCLAKEDPATQPEDGDIEVSEASPADLECMEELIIHLDKNHLITLENLNMEKATQLEVSKEYERLGLYRYRKIFIARLKNSDNIGFAICNFGSPGLNLSELTNSFRLIYSSESEEVNCRVGAALCDRVLKEYQNTEMPFPVLLNFQEYPVPVQFSKHKEYIHWWISVLLGEEFARATEVITSNLKASLKKEKMKSEKGNPGLKTVNTG